MMYLVNEGRLTLPFDCADSSMTILKFPAAQSSLTIVRGEMPAELTLSETVELQRNLFRREFKSVVLGDTQHAVLGRSPCIEGSEFFCMFDVSGIQQYQMNLLIKQRDCFITFAYTQPRAFSHEDLICWQQIKADFAIDPQWYQRIVEGGI